MNEIDLNRINFSIFKGELYLEVKDYGFGSVVLQQRQCLIDIGKETMDRKQCFVLEILFKR